MSLLFDNPYEEERPWGKFVQFTKNAPSTVKILTVNPHEAFSLQYHNKRDEFWFVVSGNGEIEIGKEKFDIEPSAKFFIAKNTPHRISAGDEAVVVLELSTDNFDENDVVRLEDKYGRVNT